MRFSSTRGRLFVLLIVTLMLILSIVVAVSSKKKQERKKPHLTSLPSISSCTSDITVEHAFLRNPESDSGELVLQLRNNTDIAVISVSIETNSKTDHSEFRNITHSFEDDKPTVLIDPHGSGEFTMEIGNIRPDGTVKVGSVTFVDGKEVGCKQSLKSLHETKSMHEAAKAARKAAKEPN
jgi:hypothetical protein